MVKELIEGLAARLTEEFGSGFSLGNIEYMRQFYLAYPDQVPANWPDSVWPKSKGCTVSQTLLANLAPPNIPDTVWDTWRTTSPSRPSL